MATNSRSCHRPRGRDDPSGRAHSSKRCCTCSPGQAHRQPAAMSSTGSLQRKCVKGHPKTAGKCSGRCIRCYPRLESAGRRAEGTWRETQPPNPT
jgi:NifB/MoaA-like Fe-S oxidoreductase